MYICVCIYINDGTYITLFKLYKLTNKYNNNNYNDMVQQLEQQQRHNIRYNKQLSTTRCYGTTTKTSVTSGYTSKEPRKKIPIRLYGPHKYGSFSNSVCHGTKRWRFSGWTVERLNASNSCSIAIVGAVQAVVAVDGNICLLYYPYC